MEWYKRHKEVQVDFVFTIYINVMAAIFGAVFGSFLNCMAWRMVHHESVWKGRSHCVECGHVLGPVDLIPILGYWIRAGKCHYCHAKISPRYMWTELLMAFVFVSFVWKYEISVLTLRYLVLGCILFTLSMIDLDSYCIPNRFIIAGIVWWAVTLPFSGNGIYSMGMEAIVRQVKSGLFGAAVIGGGLLLLSLLMDQILKKDSLGGGDIKLFFMLELYFGLGAGLFHMILACIVGIFMAAVLKKNRIPFGPAISLAAWITCLWGNDIVHWYLGLFL